jgi:histone acetyltransferase
MQDPIDVRTIGERLEAGFYTTLEMFAADFRRMFNNARIYNAPETLYYKVCTTR